MLGNLITTEDFGARKRCGSIIILSTASASPRKLAICGHSLAADHNHSISSRIKATDSTWHTYQPTMGLYGVVNEIGMPVVVSLRFTVTATVSVRYLQ